MMPPTSDVNNESIAEALQEIHRAETTAALLDSGLVDVRSGDLSNGYLSSKEEDSLCC